MKKKTMLAAAAVTVLGAGILSASTAFAQQSTTAGQDPMSSLVQKIASKFNLNKDEVQAVFDEAHQEREATMEANFEQQLSQYVSDGKITEQQKQLIIDKRKEMDSARELNKDAFKNLSDDQRKAKMESERTALESWAKSNNIDLQYLMPRGGKGGGPGMGGHRGFGQGTDNQQTTVTPTVTQ